MGTRGDFSYSIIHLVNWSEIAKLDNLFLNLGGGKNCHPDKLYHGYVTVDITYVNREWAVQHDLCTRLPLDNSSVSRILSEDFIEHLPRANTIKLLNECYRLLKPDGLMRVGIPDYNNPKDRHCLEIGYDPLYPEHKVLPTYEWVKELIASTRFRKFKIYQFWDGNEYHWEPVDYQFGIIKRTPENSKTISALNLRRIIVLSKKTIEKKISRVKNEQIDKRLKWSLSSGNVTSIVFDLYK